MRWPVVLAFERPGLESCVHDSTLSLTQRHPTIDVVGPTLSGSELAAAGLGQVLDFKEDELVAVHAR